MFPLPNYPKAHRARRVTGSRCTRFAQLLLCPLRSHFVNWKGQKSERYVAFPAPTATSCRYRNDARYDHGCYRM